MAEAENTPSGRPKVAIGATPLAGVPLAMAKQERVVASVGLVVFLTGTLPGFWPGASRALTVICVAIALLFLVQYVLRLRREPNRLEWMVTGPAIIDLLAVLPIPLALLFGADGEIVRLFGVLWALKPFGERSFALLGRVSQ